MLGSLPVFGSGAVINPGRKLVTGLPAAYESCQVSPGVGYDSYRKMMGDIGIGNAGASFGRALVQHGYDLASFDDPLALWDLIIDLAP